MKKPRLFCREAGQNYLCMTLKRRANIVNFSFFASFFHFPDKKITKNEKIFFYLKKSF